jgi:hypothetical protein
MLDLLLRYVTVRNALAVVIMAAAAPLAVRFGNYAQWRYMQANYPPQHDAGVAGKDLDLLLDQRASEKIIAQYRRVNFLLAQAKTDGFDTAALEYKASQGLAYNVPGSRPLAAQLLDETEMAVPRKKVQYIPLYPAAPNDTMSDDDTPKPKASPAKEPAAKTKARTKGKTKKKHRQVS